ncbi:DUF1499 domain-containing protein [Flavobacteriaceae bacterium]|nr:DUF1499 domain-containing protein [Flavobacteriaceae bacterium]
MNTKKIVVVVAALVSVYVLIVIGIQLKAVDVLIDPSKFPTGCPAGSQNCAFIGPEPHRTDAGTALYFQSDPDTVMIEVKRWITTQPRTTIIGEWETQIHAVFRTFWWRFPDDFIVNVHCENGETLLYVYSKSRLGISDLGVNVNRVNKFISHFKKVVFQNIQCGI